MPEEQAAWSPNPVAPPTPAPVVDLVEEHYRRVEALRDRHKITWRQVGELLDVSVSTLMNLKQKQRGPLLPATVELLVAAENREFIKPTNPRSHKKRASQPVKLPVAPADPVKEKKPEPDPDRVAQMLASPSITEVSPVTADKVATDALDILAERYRTDVGFLLSIICRDNKVKFSRALRKAPAAAVDDLRAHEGVEFAEFADEDLGPAANVVRKLIGGA